MPSSSTDSALEDYKGKFKFQKEAEFYMSEFCTFLPPIHFLPHCSAVINFELAKPEYCMESADETVKAAPKCWEIYMSSTPFSIIEDCAKVRSKL